MTMRPRSLISTYRQSKSKLLQRNSEQEDRKKSNSVMASFQETKLPIIQIKKVIKKIGAVQKATKSFTPSQRDLRQFRQYKMAELRELYPNKKSHYDTPFEFELDQIVLDCWKHGESFGRKTIWKKYKQNFDDLTFSTIKVMKKRKY